MTKSTSPKPSYSVVPWMRSTTAATCTPAASSFSLPRSTSFPTWLCVTLRASARPASTRSFLTSLSTTGMPAEAMVWAIWPPMVPAPTTAALKTNMVRDCAPSDGEGPGLYAGVALGSQLRGEAPQRALDRLALRAADEQQVERAELAARLLELVVELERDRHALRVRDEAHALHAADLLVLDRERLADARLIGGDLLEHAAAALRIGIPDDLRARVRPVAVHARDVLAAVDERRPPAVVVPELLGLARRAGHVDPRAHAAHYTWSSRRMRSIP